MNRLQLEEILKNRSSLVISAAHSGVELRRGSSSEAELGGQLVHSYLQDVTAAFARSRTSYTVSHHPHFKCSVVLCVCVCVSSVLVPEYVLLQIVLDAHKQKKTTNV